MGFIIMVLFCFIIMISTVIYTFNKILKHIETKHRIIDFEKYIAILTYYMQNAYEIIYRDRIFVYSQQGLTPKDGDIVAASRDFVKLTLDLMGSKLTSELLYLFGTNDTMFNNIIEYFNNRISKDEVREITLNKISNMSIEAK